MDRHRAEQARRRGSRRDRILQVYPCYLCKAWHTGTRPPRAPKETEKQPKIYFTEDDMEPNVKVMNTAMSDALVKAGVTSAPTLRERVWTIVNDHGPITNQALAARTGLPLNSVSRATAKLAWEGALESSRAPGSGREVRYTALGENYKDAKLYARKPIRTTSIAPAPAPPAAPRAARLGALPKEVEGFTLRQLRELRDTLNAVFGE